MWYTISTQQGAARLREARRLQGRTRLDMAFKIGVSVETIRYWERGIYFPESRLLRRVSQEYKVPLPWLIDQRRAKQRGEFDVKRAGSGGP